MVNPLINLYRTLEEAMYFKNSQLNEFYRFNGVHLLPSNNTPYIQVTNTPDGIFLEDWSVVAVNTCTGERTAITFAFMVEATTNSLNGDPQIVWSLTNVPVDFGYELVYLEIQQTLGETFYSSPFLLTDIKADKTTTFQYKQKRTDFYQCIGMESWFRQPNQTTNLTQYYETSTRKTVTSAIAVNTTEIHTSELMAVSQLIRLIDIVSLPYVYIDGKRASLFSAVEIPKMKNQENFGIVNFEVTIHENDVFVPDDFDVLVPTQIFTNAFINVFI